MFPFSRDEQQFSSARFSISSSNPSSRFSTYGPSSQSSSSSSSNNNNDFRSREISYYFVENTIPVQEGDVYCLAFSKNRLVSGCSDSKIFVWDSTSFGSGQGISSLLWKSGQGDGAVKALAASKQGDTIFSAHQDNKIRVWKKKQQQEDDKNAFQYILSASLPTFCDKFKKFMLPKNYVRVRRHRSCLWIQHSDAISCLALEEQAGLIYSCSWDRTVKVWTNPGFRCLESFRAHDDAINAVVTRNGYVYTGSADSKVKVWNRKLRRKHVLVAVLSDCRLQCSVNALVFSSDGRVLYAGMSNSTIAAWEVQQVLQDHHDKQVQDQDYQVHQKQDGKQVEDQDYTQGSQDHDYEQDHDHDPEEHMKLVGRLKGHRRSVLCLGIAGEFLCSGSADTSVRIWKHGCCLAVLRGHNAAVKCLAISSHHDNAFLVCSGGLDKRITTWNVILEEIWPPEDK